eukprot:UC4_evm2s1370
MENLKEEYEGGDKSRKVKSKKKKQKKESGSQAKKEKKHKKGKKEKQDTKTNKKREEGDEKKKKKRKKKNNKDCKRKNDHTAIDASILQKRRKVEFRTSIIPFSCKRIIAPMVGASELAFRLLCRRYGADCAFTPMIYSKRFVENPEYRIVIEKELPSPHSVVDDRDRPLVIHFCGNDPDVLLKAGLIVQNRCDAIDLNLGCPQRVAYSGHFGSYLLGEEDRPLLLNIISTLAKGLSVPLFCKIRLLDTVKETIQLCQQLHDSGASLITIHARYRGSATRRRDGPAHIDQVAEIRKALPKSVAIICNGNVRCPEDVIRNMEKSGAEGIMSAEGLLDNPTIFSETIRSCDPVREDIQIVRRRLKISKTLRQISRLEALVESGRVLTSDEQHKVERKSEAEAELRELGTIKTNIPAPISYDGPSVAREYLNIVESLENQENIDTPLDCVRFHVRRMLRDCLNDFQLMIRCRSAESRKELHDIILLCAEYKSGTRKFVFDEDLMKREKEDAELRKKNMDKRKEYEKRMMRKAKREGKPEKFYLEDGSEQPTKEDLDNIKAIEDPKLRITTWAAKFKQHCYNYHFSSCVRKTGCAFLHVSVGSKDSKLMEKMPFFKHSEDLVSNSNIRCLLHIVPARARLDAGAILLLGVAP